MKLEIELDPTMILSEENRNKVIETTLTLNKAGVEINLEELIDRAVKHFCGLSGEEQKRILNS